MVYLCSLIVQLYCSEVSEQNVALNTACNAKKSVCEPLSYLYTRNYPEAMCRRSCFEFHEHSKTESVYYVYSLRFRFNCSTV